MTRKSLRDDPARAGALVWGLAALAPIAIGALWAVAYSIGATGLLSHGWTLRFWRQVLGTSEFWQSLALSTLVGLAATGLALAAGLALALSVRSRLRRGALAGALSFPLATPPMVGAFVGLQILGGSGLAARVCAQLGWIRTPDQFPSLVNDPFALGIVLVHASLAVPFFALLMAQAWEQENIGLYSDAAASLGATAGQRLRRVEAPLLLRRASGSAVFVFLAILGSYEVPLLLGRQAPQMLSVLVMRKLARYDLTDRPEAFVIALLYAALTAAGVWWVSRPRGRAYAR